jgi:cell division septal protein FtsQ
VEIEQTTEQQLLGHAERQTKALEALRSIAVLFTWLFVAFVFVAAIVWYVAAVS